jgi:hypothetical protein
MLLRAWIPLLLATVLGSEAAGQVTDVERGRAAVRQYLEARSPAQRDAAVRTLESLGPDAVRRFETYLGLEDRFLPEAAMEGEERVDLGGLDAGAYLQLPAAALAPAAGAPVLVVLLPSQLTDQEAADLFELHLGTAFRDAGWVVAVPRPFLLDEDSTFRLDPTRPAYVRWTAGSAEVVPYIVAHLGRSYRVDVDRVHLLGIGDGGDGALWAAARYADRLATVVSIDGHPTGRKALRFLTNLRSVRVRADRGLLERVEGNRPRLGVPDLEGLRQMLRAAGIDLADGDPLVDPKAHTLQVDTLREWLATRRRPPQARVLRWFTDRPGYGACQWLDILACGERASITVEARPAANQLVIRHHDEIQALDLHLDRLTYDPSRPLQVLVGDQVVYTGTPGASVRHLLQGWQRRGDPGRLYPWRVELELR